MTPTTALAGELRLRIGVRGPRSVAVEQFHTGALRVLRPHYLDRSGQVCYTAINPGGGYLGGDWYRFQLDVDAGASVLFTSQAATKVYRTPTEPARQHTEIRLGPDAVLESLPDQLIVYREGSYEQTTRAEVDPTATYIATEVVTPGWAPEGTRFGYRRAVLRTDSGRSGPPRAARTSRPPSSPRRSPLHTATSAQIPLFMLWPSGPARRGSARRPGAPGPCRHRRGPR